MLVSFFFLLVPPILFTLAGTTLHDTAHMVYNAREIVAGRVPYRDVWNHHFLGFLVPLVVIERLFGLSLTTLGMLLFVVQLLTLLGTRKILQNLGLSGRSLDVGTMFAALLSWLPGWQGNILNCQSLLLPLVTWSFLGFLRIAEKKEGGLAFRVGLLLGLALASDQRLLVLLLPAFVALLLSGACIRLGALLGLGIVSILLPAGIYLSVEGAIPEFISQTFIFPFRFRNAGLQAPFLERFLQTVFACIQSEPILLCSLICAPLAFIFPDFLKIPRRKLSIVGGMAVVGLLYCSFGGRTYLNYALLFGPFTIVVFLLGALRLIERSQPMPRRLGAGFLLLFASLIASHTIVLNYDGLVSSNEGNQQVAAYIEAHTTPTQQIFVWGYCPQIYILSHRLTGLREMGLLTIQGERLHGSGAGNEHIVKEFVEEFYRYLKNNPPDYVIVKVEEESRELEPRSICHFVDGAFGKRETYDVMKDFLRREYQIEQRVADGGVVLGIYRRNGLGAPTQGNQKEF